jgi:hypothetical protein
MPTTYTKIATVTVGAGGAASIDFTSIPATYTDLKLVWSTRSSADNYDMGVTYNGSNANVTSRILWHTTAGTVISEANNYAYYVMNPSGSTASTFCSGELYMPNYAGSTNKSFSVDMVTENNGSVVRQGLQAGLNSNTAAITSIGITPNAGNFVQHSTATLYGIKNS